MVIKFTRRAALCLALAGVSGAAYAQLEKTNLKFSQGWLFQATQAQFSLADQKGFWKAEGLSVDVDRGSGSATSVQRVIAGTHDLGFADVGTIVKWNAENPDRPLMMVYVGEDGNPLVAIALKKSGIAKPKDLEGKKLGAPVFDGGRQMFPVFATATGIDLAKVTWLSVDANLREQLLVKGDLDAITGFNTSTLPTIAQFGVKPEDLTVLRYKDYGVEGFGNAIFATKDFVEKNPKTVTAFVKGLNNALKEEIANPDAALDALKVRDGLMNVQTERGRMKLHIDEQVLTDNIKTNGLSNVPPAKLEKVIADTLKAFNLPAGKVTPAGVWTDKFLPPKADRMPPVWKVPASWNGN